MLHTTYHAKNEPTLQLMVLNGTHSALLGSRIFKGFSTTILHAEILAIYPHITWHQGMSVWIKLGMNTWRRQATSTPK
jgi:hypothetical protein